MYFTYAVKSANTCPNLNPPIDATTPCQGPRRPLLVPQMAGNTTSGVSGLGLRKRVSSDKPPLRPATT